MLIYPASLKPRQEKRGQVKELYTRTTGSGPVDVGVDVRFQPQQVLDRLFFSWGFVCLFSMSRDTQVVQPHPNQAKILKTPSAHADSKLLTYAACRTCLARPVQRR